MPYCPSCDMEFIDGITTCTDCGAPLADSKETADALKAKEQAQIQEKIQQELKMQMQNNPVTTDDKDTQPPARPVRARVYVKKSQQYEDLKSSATAFYLMGAVLLIFTLLCWTKIINLPIYGPSRIITQSVLTAMGIISFIVAISSSKSAKKVSSQIDEEELATKQLIEWFTTHHTSKDLDIQITNEYGELSPEEFSLTRFSLIQDILITNHDILDQSYIDLLTEEIYSQLYED